MWRERGGLSTTQMSWDVDGETLFAGKPLARRFRPQPGVAELRLIKVDLKIALFFSAAVDWWIWGWQEWRFRTLVAGRGS